jgi:hypothetical protein
VHRATRAARGFFARRPREMTRAWSSPCTSITKRTGDESREAVRIAEFPRRQRSSHASNFELSGRRPQPSSLL